MPSMIDPSIGMHSFQQALPKLPAKAAEQYHFGKIRQGNVAGTS
ncbi:hypothetical protein [Xanthomonas bundabergensis]